MRCSPLFPRAAASGALLLSSTALAQTITELPAITVTAPSPIFAPPAALPAGAETWLPAANPAGPFIIVDNTFSPVTVIPRAEIERTQPRTLGEALFTRPGVTASTFAPGGASRPVIRGLDNFRVRIQENGVGAHDVSALGEDHGVPIDPLAADQIEVIRGPATLRYGSQAIGGVVATSNNRIPVGLPPDGFSARTTASVSSVDRGRETASSVDAGSGNFAAHADWFARSADDYRIPGGGVQPNSSAFSDGASLGGSYLLPNGFMGVGFSHIHSIYHVPGGESAETRTRIDLNQEKVFGRGEIRPSSEAIEAIRYWFGASDYKHNEIGVGEESFGTQATFINREQEFRIEAQHTTFATPLGQVSGALGFQLGHRFIGTSGDAGNLLKPTTTETAATYLFEELKVNEALRIQAALRGEYARVRGSAATFPADFVPTGDDPAQSARERQFGPKSASLAALYRFPIGIVASITGQYVERAPESPELYSQGSHDAPGTFEIGNAELRKEKARSIEIGLRKAEGPWRFDATGYYTDYTGFIYKRQTGLRCGEDFASCGTDTDFTQVVYSQQDATFYGAELLGQLDLFEWGPGKFGIDAQYDFVHAQFRDGTYVPRIPPHRLGGGLYYQDRHWFARIGLLHAFDHTETAPNETSTPGYDLLKAEVSYTQKLDRARYGLTDLTVGVVGNNLLDDRIRNSVSFKKDEILLPGRDVRLFGSVRF